MRVGGARSQDRLNQRRFAEAGLRSHWRGSSALRWPSTRSTCSPQPAHEAFLHALQVTGRHIVMTNKCPDIYSNVNLKPPTRLWRVTAVEVGAVEGIHERLHLGRV